MDIKKKFIGIVKDRMNTLPARRTRRKDSWIDAQKAAEKMAKGDRWAVVVVDTEGYRY